LCGYAHAPLRSSVSTTCLALWWSGVSRLSVPPGSDLIGSAFLQKIELHNTARPLAAESQPVHFFGLLRELAAGRVFDRGTVFFGQLSIPARYNTGVVVIRCRARGWRVWYNSPLHCPVTVRQPMASPASVSVFCLFPAIELSATLWSFAILARRKTSCEPKVWFLATVNGCVQSSFLRIRRRRDFPLSAVVVSHRGIISSIAVAVKLFSTRRIHISVHSWSVVNYQYYYLYIATLVSNYLLFYYYIYFMRYGIWGCCTQYYIILIFRMLMFWEPVYYDNSFSYYVLYYYYLIYIPYSHRP